LENNNGRIISWKLWCYTGLWKSAMAQEIITDIFSRVRKGPLGFLVPGWLFNRRVRITRAGAGFLFLIFFVGFAAINTANNLLYLIVGIMISLLLASFFLSESTIDSLLLERILPEQVQAEREFSITYRLANQKRWLPSLGILIEDEFEGMPCRVFFPGVRAGLCEFQRAAVRAKRRGRLKMGGVNISTRHPFGFFYKSKQANLAGGMVVCPHVEKVSPQVITPPYLSGEMRRATKGEGAELFGFRDYLRGDSPRLILWKISAKAGKLTVREHEEEKKRAVTIELMLSGPRPEQDDPKREDMISRAAGLAEHFLDRKYQVRLELGARGVDFGEGLSHLRRILYYLAVFDDREDPWLGDRLEPVNSISRVAV
jgi:uncharacterized protein (DUF58 family)